MYLRYSMEKFGTAGPFCLEKWFKFRKCKGKSSYRISSELVYTVQIQQIIKNSQYEKKYIKVEWKLEESINYNNIISKDGFFIKTLESFVFLIIYAIKKISNRFKKGLSYNNDWINLKKSHFKLEASIIYFKSKIVL